MKTVSSIFLFSVAWLSAFTVSGRASEPVADPALKEGRVMVEIFEGVDGLEFSEGKMTARYREPGMGFVRIPTPFSENALPLDRSSPFLLKARLEQHFAQGSYQIRLRSKGAAELFVDGVSVLTASPQTPNKSSHDEIPPPPERDVSGLRPAPPPHQDLVASIELADGVHEFTLKALIGGKGLVPDPDELSVSIGRPGEISRLLGEDDAPLLTDEGWTQFASERQSAHGTADRIRRRQVSHGVRDAWSRYHEQVRQSLDAAPLISPPPSGEETASVIDRFIAARQAEKGIQPQPLIQDLPFLRRLTLDVAGRIPSADEVRAFLAAPEEKRREEALERLLEDGGWADHWVSYWQDALAENPGILKPDLNNSGPFRWWLHQSFEDNLPLDRFAAELIQMEGSVYKGAPAAFALATLNDSPMAAKADIISQAFLGEKLSCARCHDAPHHAHRQKDTFSLAAMLAGKDLKLPESSTVPVVEGARQPRVEISLKPGATISPEWPFDHLGEKSSWREKMPLSRKVPETRNRVAAMIIDPENERFPRVIVNRVWKRYMGTGLVEPADDWDSANPSHPELLQWLARDFVLHGYDLKRLARQILSSKTYQRQAMAGQPRSGPSERWFEGPAPRRMSAEQLVDSLFLAAGKNFGAEELNLNPLGDRPLREFLNLGQPARAWEFTALMNERDRPSLALPMAQSIIDVLGAFGWRQSRQNPVIERQEAPSSMQTLLLANGVMGTRVTRLSDDSAFTALALKEQSLAELIDQTFLRTLSRFPTGEEKTLAAELLEPRYEERIQEGVEITQSKYQSDRRVSWANHFDEESNAIRMEEERALRMGAEPTTRLSTPFREAYEDLIWSLVNSAEFITVP